MVTGRLIDPGPELGEMINPIGLIQTSSLAAADLSNDVDHQSTVYCFLLCWERSKISFGEVAFTDQ